MVTPLSLESLCSLFQTSEVFNRLHSQFQRRILIAHEQYLQESDKVKVLLSRVISVTAVTMQSLSPLGVVGKQKQETCG